MPRDAVGPVPRLDEEQGLDGVALHCVACGALVTRTDWAIAMNGDHQHVVFNPAGMLFRVACFREAPGCHAIGAPSSQFSWFKGYGWRIAQCRGCGEHLGWMFAGEASPPVFFGLIRPKLTDKPA